MEPATEAAEPLDELGAETPPWPGSLRRGRTKWVRLAYERVRFALLVYLGSRVLLLAVAIANGALRHHALLNELANWDGFWYRSVANIGYPHHVIHAQTNLGFFPLYPWVI